MRKKHGKTVLQKKHKGGFTVNNANWRLIKQTGFKSGMHLLTSLLCVRLYFSGMTVLVYETIQFYCHTKALQ